jgi:hypothetical protein
MLPENVNLKLDNKNECPKTMIIKSDKESECLIL